MNFYVDFEATQFSNRIISIGCTNELGEKFETLVKPVNGDKINKFITDLTGITPEMVENAPTADEAFNALLKTLEEPVPNTVFVLATTEYQKVPATIVSRCQRYQFKLLSDDEIYKALDLVCDTENIQVEDKDSVLHYYQKLIALRKKYQVVVDGSYSNFNSDDYFNEIN